MDLSSLEKQSTEELFITLLKVMDELRGPKGCPWDKKQTPASLIPCLLEETYEVIAAIDEQDPAHLKEELGDLLLQVVFHSRIASEEKTFEIGDVIRHLIEKLVRRHPHVFAEGEVAEAEEALKQWEQIKAEEKDPNALLLEGVPVQLPALARAYRIGAKAARVGFDWPNVEGVLDKVAEELEELHEGISEENQDAVEDEFGDLLFSIAQTARFLKSRQRAQFATQSGPMLVIGGRIHPRIHGDGMSQKFRNGVCVDDGHSVRFAISNQPVTFHQFARLFRDRLQCKDALFLDGGSASALYARSLSRHDRFAPTMGPIVGVVEKANR